MDESAKKTDDITPKPVEVVEPVALKAKKHRKWPWVLLIIALVLLIPLSVLAYFGFVPGVSNLVGANKPKDLGVRYTAADFASYQTKTGGKFLDFANAPVNPLKPGKKIVFANPEQMDVTLTQEEITATINSVGWAWMPLTNAQIRFSGGNLVEVSGNLNTSNIANFVKFIGGVGYDQASVDKAIGWAKKLAGNPAVYIKAVASVSNNQPSINIQQVTIGRFNAPLSQAQTALTAGVNSVKKNAADTYNAQSATFSNGSLHFVGTAPTTVYVKH